MNKSMEMDVQLVVDQIVEDYGNGRAIDKQDVFNQPNKEVIIDMIQKLFRIVYPGYYADRVYHFYSVKNSLSALIEDVMFHLNRQIAVALRYHSEYENCTSEELAEVAKDISTKFLQKIPHVREYLDTDLQAAYDGDPAATSKDEIIYAYPGFYAITINRLAHELFLLQVPMIPRIMTEHAHSLTGIDIHPGATIGKYFFIDHGTGIVVGETTVIGDNVKMYQGVTLGALSTRGGQKLKNKKRHPTIEDNVTIYSGASILGGETVIGHDVVIGGNAFITKSVAPGMRVSIKNQELIFNSSRSSSKSQSVGDVGQDESWTYII